MRGEILSYDDQSGAGLISGDDGVRYTFSRADLAQLQPIRAGQKVDFVPLEGAATQIMLTPGAVAGGFSVDGLDWQKLFLSFDGRIRRSHFWVGWLVILGVSVVLGWIPVLGSLIAIALLWPYLAISVKRLHDMGRSGWLVLAPFGISIICMVVGFGIMGAGIFAAASSSGYNDAAGLGVLAAMGPALLLFSISALVGLAFLLWVGLSESQPGENRFGSNPKGQ